MAKSNTKTVKLPSMGELTATFSPERVEHILSIMKSDKIPYWRAVRRSRRRLINEGRWD